MLKTWLLAVVLLAAGPAWADTTAVYKSPRLGGEMTIEIAANGDVRATTGTRGDYVILRGGEVYMVFFTDKGPVVDRMSDVGAAMADWVRDKMPEFGKMPDGEFPDDKMIDGGVVTVNGRAGKVWYLGLGGGQPSADFSIVISTDPALADIGTAMVRQTEASMLMMRQAMGGKHGLMGGTLDVLRTGTPLRLMTMELTSVTHTPIPAERFVLPAEPETREQVRARFAANGGHIP
ncbi:MAG: hypothetical protein V4574_14690 [Pseudomonadota bacterium]